MTNGKQLTTELLTTDHQMFIPRGEIIHESLATSYVLVDALVADLCEGGFSGIIEVVLRDTDSFIVIASGDVAAVVEKHGDQDRNGAAITYTRTTVERLADRSRRERGRVSIYAYSAATATAVAGRINAQPLYVGLSTEFTDLEKMIWKLVRERDRELFIEINNEDGPGSLIHMCDTRFGIISSTGAADSGPLELPGNVTLRKLLDECNRAGGLFDVYFTRAAETIDVPAGHPQNALIPELPPTQAAIGNEEPIESQLASVQRAASGSLPSDGLFVGPGQHLATREIAAPGLAREEQIEGSSTGRAVAAPTRPSFAPLAEALEPRLAEELIEPQAGDLSLGWDELPPVTVGAEAMTDTKRLMGDIARVIEEAAQAVGRADSFSMSLRAGQLKIAERFPFLDPFAGEFEYLAGEIVFVGRATTGEFVVGFTEALTLAVEAVMRSTAYPDRFRSYVTEDLHKLLARERAEFEKLGLDQVIQEIIS